MTHLNPFVFTGRIGRWTFLSRYAFWFIVTSGLLAAIGTIDPDPQGGLLGLAVTFGQVFLTIVTVSLGVRRLHDLNASGWWYALSLIPLVGIILVIVLLVAPGTPGANRYGVRTDRRAIGGLPPEPTPEPPLYEADGDVSRGTPYDAPRGASPEAHRGAPRERGRER